MCLNHPISDISANMILVGRFLFQPQQTSRIRYLTFKGYLIRLETKGHRSGLQICDNRLALKEVEEGFKACAYQRQHVPVNETSLLYALSLWLCVDTKDPSTETSHGQEKCVTLVLAYCSLLNRGLSWNQSCPWWNVSLSFPESGHAPVLCWSWTSPVPSLSLFQPHRATALELHGDRTGMGSAGLSNSHVLWSGPLLTVQCCSVSNYSQMSAGTSAFWSSRCH